MPAPKISQSALRDTMMVAARYVTDPNFYWIEKEKPHQKSAIQAIADEMGIAHTAVRSRVMSAEVRYGWKPEHFTTALGPSDEELQDLPDGFEVLQRNKAANTEYIAKARKKWKRLIPVRAEPFAVAFVGDPHLDNKGCDLAAVEADLAAIRASGMRAVNMGDILDNFHKTSKLAAKQASNRVSASEALALARWFIRDSGVQWDAHIVGNHCAWLGDQGEQLLKQWGYQAGSRFYEWTAQITYSWDGGQYTVLASHDFKGGSVYNPVHGLMKRALEDGTADLYVAGHRHTAAQAGEESGFRGRRYEHLRVKGYKAWDEYAFVKGFSQQEEGATGVAVIDPFSETMAGRCRTFLSVFEAQEYLGWLKSRP